MKIIILEDELLALEKLQSLIAKYDESIEVVATADSIESAISIFNAGIEYDLLLCDIELADGSSFEVFKQVEINKPVIFTTAYDQYAMDAFDVYCIDYLLKPLSYPKLKEALDKFKERVKMLDEPITADLVKEIITHRGRGNYKKRFLAKLGNKLVFKRAEEVSYFYAEGKTVYLVEAHKGHKFIVDHSLEELEKELLDPDNFYRINRSFIVNLDDLMEIRSYHNGRLKLHINTHCEKDIIVAREKVSSFKSWLNQ